MGQITGDALAEGGLGMAVASLQLKVELQGLWTSQLLFNVNNFTKKYGRSPQPNWLCGMASLGRWWLGYVMSLMFPDPDVDIGPS